MKLLETSCHLIWDMYGCWQIEICTDARDEWTSFVSQHMKCIAAYVVQNAVNCEILQLLITYIQYRF